MKAPPIAFLCCTVLAGCDAVTNVEWAKTVPGIYEGAESGFKERVDLRSDGSFQHTVSYDGKQLVGEAGKWSFDVHSGAVRVGPFTAVWDQESRKLTTNVTAWTTGALFVMRYGHAAERISPSADFSYQLRKQTNSTR